nr:reverse transcriptase domain-containing protein [Tanacetum cinerariifolium]
MPPKRTSTSEAPTITLAAIRQLVADSVTTALETQVANMANADNTNINPKPRETPIARKCSYKEFMSCQPFNFKGSKGVVRLIQWFERIESAFSRRNCTKDCKVTGHLWLNVKMTLQLSSRVEAFRKQFITREPLKVDSLT